MTHQDDHQDKYRILVEQASDGIAIYGRDGKIIEVNSRACELLGFTREELLALNVSDVIAPHNLAETPLRYEALQSGQPLLGERILLRKDGTTVPVELSARMLSDGRFQVLIRDITQRKVLEEEIRRSRDYYLTLLEGFPAMIWQADTDAKCNYVNHTWLNFTGRNLEQELGDGWVECIHPEDRDRCLETYLTAFHARQPFLTEYRARRYDGEYRWLRDQGAPFYDLDFEFAGYLGSCYDITEQKNAEREIRRLNAELEQRVTERTSQLADANRDLRMEVTERKRVEEERSRLLQSEQEARQQAEFAVQVREELLAIVSHDLKNPLAAIKGNSQLIRKRIAQMGVSDSERALAPLFRIDEATNRMNVLLNDLLDFGRLQAGQSLTLQRRPTDLVALARKVALEFQEISSRSSIGRHPIVIETELTHLTGLWDSMRLEQVTDNLMSNAIKYSPNGGEIKLCITREAGADGHDWAVLKVCDRGIGISPDDIPHVFEWFRRARNTSGRISGAGIGLASASYIISQHGGEISVSSEPGTGSVFEVKLPL
jgi:PAS domain S-box-containing protein